MRTRLLNVYQLCGLHELVLGFLVDLIVLLDLEGDDFCLREADFNMLLRLPIGGCKVSDQT